MTVTAILLAAGESSRMGLPKPLLEWDGYTLIEYQLAQLKGPPIDRVVDVLGQRGDPGPAGRHPQTGCGRQGAGLRDGGGTAGPEPAAGVPESPRQLLRVRRLP
ncbi:MAG: hypothetical protein E3J29_04625 [Dehalococcoidia bacterium]|nr:MAG: hypothetical protein E3J29_04625 [Dehalococcoidia bacterium]